MPRVQRDGSPVSAAGSAVGLGVFGFMTGVVVSTLLLFAVGSVVPGAVDRLPVRQAISTVGMGIGLVAVALAYLRSNGLRLSYLGLRWPTFRDLALAVAATVGLFAAALLALAAAEFFGASPTGHSVIEAADRDPRVLLVLAPLAVLVTGPAEELLYRGVIQTRLREGFGAVATVLVASVIFAVAHVPAYATGGLDASVLTSIGVVFLLGAFLGAAYERTENLVVPAIAHGLFNATVYGHNYVNLVAFL